MSFKEFEVLNEVQSIRNSYEEIKNSYDHVAVAGFDLEESSNLSASLDWRLSGAVTSVKDQKLCGSCYIMAVIASIESHLFLTKGELLDLSVQEVVDCGGKFQGGCDGGLPTLVLYYVNTKGGISLESDYPYEGVKNTCRSGLNQRKNISNLIFQKNPNYDEEVMQEALINYGPIVVFFDIAHESFMRYSSGIYYDPECSQETNHVGLLVGYGSDNGADFWIVKNSYGESWGEDGYIRIARNQQNHCGMGKVYYVVAEEEIFYGD